ncbi:hypothetical protein CVH10_15755 [Halomonas sp. ND22Bw]|nr:hypothetical protein CVH10_15755 [Halomonas sp. ND22Bw]
MLTFGGYKGSALSIMIELLAGPLIGDLSGHETSPANEDGTGRPWHGELIVAIDPHRLLGDEAARHRQHAEARFAGVLAQGARRPSRRRHEARRRSREQGVTIPRGLHQQLVRVRDGARG